MEDNTPVSTGSAPDSSFLTLKEAERAAATNAPMLWQNMHDALSWLFQSSSNIPTNRVVTQAIGPFPNDWPVQLAPLFNRELEPFILENLCGQRIIPGREHRVERLIRSYRSVQSNKPVPYLHIWILKPNLFEPPFDILASILVHRSPLGYAIAHTESLSGPRWYAHDLLAHVVRHAELPESVRLPRDIWRRLIQASYQHGPPYIDGLEANTQIFEFALMNLFGSPMNPRDNVTVQIFDGAVPLWSWISDILLTRAEGKYMSLDSLQLRRLLIMHDYTFPLLQDSAYQLQTSFKILTSIWHGISRLESLTPIDSRTVWVRAEDIFMHPLFSNSWVDVSIPYRSSTLQTLASSCSDLIGVDTSLGGSVVTPNKDFLNKIVADFFFALRTEDSRCELLSHKASSIWSLALQRDIVDAYTSFTSSMSCFTSIPIPVFHIFAHLYPLMTAFVAGLRRGAISSAVLTGCTEDLCQPNNLFVACQILAIGSRGLTMAISIKRRFKISSTW